MDIRELVGKNVRRIRLSKNISQEKLAALADIDRTYIQSIESGKRNVSVLVLDKISKALQVTISELIEDVK